MKQMDGVYALLCHFSVDEGLPSTFRRDMLRGAELLFEEKPMLALTYLCKMRAMCALSMLDGTAYVQATEAIAIAYIAAAQTLEQVAEVRTRLRLWANTPQLMALMIAREAGLRAIAIEKAKKPIEQAKE